MPFAGGKIDHLHLPPPATTPRTPRTPRTCPAQAAGSKRARRAPPSSEASESTPLVAPAPPCRLSDTLANVVLGAADGFTVPFALAAALAHRVSTPSLVVVAVVAELAAGAVAMGLGGYLAAQTAAATAEAERARIERILSTRHGARTLIKDALSSLRLSETALVVVADSLASNPATGARFIRRVLSADDEEEEGCKPLRAAAAVGLSYAVAGVVPLAPYLVTDDVGEGLRGSVALGLCALAAFGAVRAKMVGGDWRWGALQTTLLGALAAGVAYTAASAFE